MPSTSAAASGDRRCGCRAAVAPPVSPAGPSASAPAVPGGRRRRGAPRCSACGELAPRWRSDPPAPAPAPSGCAWSTPSGTLGRTARTLGAGSVNRRASIAWVVGAGERRLAREHLVEHRGQAVDVGPRVELAVARRLLRAHVGRRADGEPGLGEPRVAAAQRPGDPEVGHQGVAVPGEQEVLRLDVAVDHALVVGVVRAPAPPPGRSGARPRPASWRSRASRSRRLSPSTYGMVNQSRPRGLARVVAR